MLAKIIDTIYYKFEEFKTSHKILAKLDSVILENNKIKILYHFKSQSLLKAEQFDLDNLSKIDLDFDKNEEIILYKIKGVYEFLLSNNQVNTIQGFLEQINKNIKYDL